MRRWLFELRKSFGMTQAMIAEKAGISRSTYTLIELGKRNPTIDKAKKISDALNVSGEMFFLNDNTEIGK